MVQNNSVLGLGIGPSIVTVQPPLGIRNGLGLSSTTPTVAAIIAAAGFVVANDLTCTYACLSSAYNPTTDAIVGPGVRRRRPQAFAGTSYNMDWMEVIRANILAAGTSERFDRWTAVNSLAVTADTTAAPNGEVIAQTLTDPGATLSSAQQTFAVANDSLVHTFSIYVLKTAGGTAPTFGVTLALTGGTGVTTNARINTDTGAQQYGSNVNTTVEASSAGTWWRVIVSITNNTTGNTTLTLDVYPAASAYGASVDAAAATGSAICTFACLIKGSSTETTAAPSSYVSCRNCLLQTQTLNTTWTKTRCTITSDSTANPIDGAVNADTINEDNTATNTHFIGQSFTKAAAAIQFTFSTYLKQSGRTWAFVQCSDTGITNGAGIYFDVANGVKGTAVVLGAGWTLDASTITAVGAWYRVTITVTTATSTTIRAEVYTATADLGAIIVTPLNAAALICWGNQLVYGAKPMDYWAVVGTSGRRERQDLATATSLALDTAHGSVFCIVMPYEWSGDDAFNTSQRIVACLSGPNDLSITKSGTPTWAFRRTNSGAVGEIATFTTAFVNGVASSVGGSWSSTGVFGYFNGAPGTPDGDVTPPYIAGTDLEIGGTSAAASAAQNFNGPVLVLYSTVALSPADFATLAGAVAP